MLMTAAHHPHGTILDRDYNADRGENIVEYTIYLSKFTHVDKRPIHLHQILQSMLLSR